MAYFSFPFDYSCQASFMNLYNTNQRKLQRMNPTWLIVVNIVSSVQNWTEQSQSMLPSCLSCHFIHLSPKITASASLSLSLRMTWCTCIEFLLSFFIFNLIVLFFLKRDDEMRQMLYFTLGDVLFFSSSSAKYT